MNKPSKLPPILPLEYCRIERASRLLGCCEVEDILHWGAIGKISLRVSAEELQPSTVEYDGMDTSNVVGGKVVFISGGSEHYQQMLAEGGRVKISKYAEMTIDEEWKGTQGGNQFLFWKGTAHGFWRVSRQSIHQFLYGRFGIGTNWVFLSERGSYSHNKDKSFDGLVPVGAVGDMRDRLYIMYKDLQLLQKHILSGEQLPDSEDLARQVDISEAQIAMMTPHPTAERHASNREKVLAAAIYAKHKWPNECGDVAISWAETLSNHEGTLFEAGTAPLSLEIMAGILSEAMETGRPRKKQ
jgi:hypothetical protein